MTAKPVSVSPRVQIILDHRHDHYDPKEINNRDPYYYQAFSECENDIKALQFAKGFANFLQHKKILIKNYDLLAGFAYRYTYHSTMAINMPSDFDPQFRPPSYMDPQKEIQDCIHALHLDPNGEDAKKLNIFTQAISVWLYKHWECGHIMPGYERLLQKGFGGLIEEGKSYLEKAKDAEQKQYLQAMILCDDAAGQYILRYAAMARDLAEHETDSVFKKDLSRIAAACEQIAYGVPRNFFEAIQLIWLAHEILYCENYPASESFGRLDKYLQPFYEADIASGLLTKEEAIDYIDALWIKFGITLHAYENVTIGGCNPDGTGYMDNDLTKFFMQANRKMRFDQPLLTLRYNDAMPEDVWDEAISLILTGTGFPAFFGEKACIANKMRIGIPEADAREFGLIGCVELAVPGKEYAKTEVLRINWGKIMELMLNGGQCTMGEDRFPLAEYKDLDSIQTFDEFFQWYQDELIHFTQLAVDCINLLDQALVLCYPTPYLSSLIEGCFAKGMDVTGGGALYNETGINACGMANVVDSLAAIKKLVFDEKKVSLSTFAKALRNNYEGYQDLHTAVTYHCPHYGNDDDSVDQYYQKLVSLYGDFVDRCKNPRGGRWQLGWYSVEDHAKMGIHTGALPDGKYAGQALANAASPVQGHDITGPTAAINSLLKFDQTTATNGIVLDLKFSPSYFDNKRHEQALKDMIRTYFDEGGVEIQFNVVDRSTLVNAQKDPAKYKDLVVRVSGFSAYFTSLIKETQDEIIARTEYSAI